MVQYRENEEDGESEVVPLPYGGGGFITSVSTRFY